MRIDDLTPIKRQIILAIDQITDGSLTVFVSKGVIQQPEVKIKMEEFLKVSGKSTS